MPTNRLRKSKPSFWLSLNLRTGCCPCLLLYLAVPLGAQQTVKINVLSLFHPQTLLLTPSRATTLELDTTTLTLAAHQPIRIDQLPRALRLSTPATSLYTTALTLPATTFTLTVPNKLTRTYTGILTLTRRGAFLEPVVTMPLEQAVASVVAAEAAPGTPPEALKAQAVVSRSYLLAHPAHRAQGFDACDTTHCQWLRAAPLPTSPAARATQATAGEVLFWQPDPQTPRRLVAARFSQATGASTETLRAAAGYPFPKVLCQTCQSRHTARAGNGIGLCQQGAADLAARGQGYGQILHHYFPNTTTGLHGSR